MRGTRQPAPRLQALCAAERASDACTVPRSAALPRPVHRLRACLAPARLASAPNPGIWFAPSQDYAAVALLAIICSLLETLVGKDGMLNDAIPDFALLQALQWVSC